MNKIGIKNDPVFILFFSNTTDTKQVVFDCVREDFCSSGVYCRTTVLHVVDVCGLDTRVFDL